MASDDDISLWIQELRTGEESAARKLWEHFARQLTDAARKRLRPETRRVYDEEDAAQSAFRSLWAGLAAGRFPDLRDRDSLWRLLLVITARKVSHRHRYDRQGRRDVKRTETGSTLLKSSETRDTDVQFVSREPTPEFTAEFIDTCEVLLEKLEDAELTQIAWLKIEGYTGEEIAAKLGCSRRTVYRRLEIIRRVWEEGEIL